MTSLLSVAQFMAASLSLSGGPPPTPPADLDWDLLANHADGHTLTPLLASIWQDSGVLERAPEPTRNRLLAALADNGLRQAVIRAELLELTQLLTAAGVPHLVLKGWPLVERLYAQPAHRLLRDHDLLVHPEHLSAGYSTLLAAGFTPLPGDDTAVDKHAQPVWRNQGYVWNGYLFDPNYPRPVELHTRLWDAHWRGLTVLQLPDLWADAQIQTVAGAPMQLMSDEKTVAHLSMHFAGHLIEREARLSQLLDLARFVQYRPALDWDRLLSVSPANLHRFLYTSLYLAHAIFNSELPPAAVWQTLSQHTPAALRQWLADQAVTDALTTDFRRRRKGKDYQLAYGNNATEPAAFESHGRDYQLTFLAANSLTERIGILRFAALPPAEQLMAKYNVRGRWSLPFLYPRHIVERLGQYGLALFNQ